MSTNDEPDVAFLFANADLAGRAGIAAWDRECLLCCTQPALGILWHPLTRSAKSGQNFRIYRVNLGKIHFWTHPVHWCSCTTVTKEPTGHEVVCFHAQPASKKIACARQSSEFVPQTKVPRSPKICPCQEEIGQLEHKVYRFQFLRHLGHDLSRTQRHVLYS